jgi:threonine synthase
MPKYTFEEIPKGCRVLFKYNGKEYIRTVWAVSSPLFGVRIRWKTMKNMGTRAYHILRPLDILKVYLKK